MKVFVVGAGAIGSYFGARLVEAGESVSFLAREKRAELYRTHGIRITSICGDAHIANVNTLTESELLATNEGFDVVLLAIKSPQVPDIINLLKKIVKEDTLLISLLNGVHQKERLSKHLPMNNICTAIANIIVSEKAVGDIQHTGVVPHITLESKELCGDLLNKKFKRLNEALTRANIDFSIKTDIRRSLWQKFCFVAPWGVLASAVKLPIGEILADDNLRSDLNALIAEYVTIAEAHGVTLNDNAAEKIFEAVNKLPANSTTSLQRDLYVGKVGEFDALCQYPFDFAKANQLYTPVLNRYCEILSNLSQPIRNL
ncbi:ketopantoate reductase family protein [Thalassotalea fusca]